LQYDVVKDFEPVLLLADAPLLLVASKAVPANDLKEFIAWLAKSRQIINGNCGRWQPRSSPRPFTAKGNRHTIWAGGLSRGRPGDAGCCGGADRDDVC